MKNSTPLTRLFRFWKKLMEKFSMRFAESGIEESDPGHEVLEPRILYTAAPVDAPPGAEPAPTEDVAPEPEQPAAEQAPAAGEPAPAEASPAAEGVTEVPADQNVELVEIDDKDTTLNEDTLQAIAEAAAQRWRDTGISTEQADALDAIQYSIADLEGNRLGSADGGTVTIDHNAAGRKLVRRFNPRTGRGIRCVRRYLGGRDAGGCGRHRSADGGDA